MELNIELKTTDKTGTSPNTSNNGLFSSRPNSSASSQKKRKLILHFDQHNTIQVACTLPGRSLTVEEGLNNFLTTAVWGIENENTNEWVWRCDEPQINKPPNEPYAISYFKYLEKKIVKSPEDRAELKKRTCQFVYNEPGSKFREFFDFYLESLIYDFGLRGKRSSKQEENLSNDDLNSLNFFDWTKLPSNTIRAGDPENKSLYHLILPDFFDMMRRFQKEKRQFCIILRTMGIESASFLNTVRSVFEADHKYFPDLKPMSINPNIGHIKRSLSDQIELEMDGEVYYTDEAIYKKLTSLEGVNAIRDDFAYWQKNCYECYSAKPLWINLLDQENQHIIFDDNIRLDSIDDCIANLRLTNSTVKEYENVHFDCYNIFDKSSIIQPNLIHLLNPLQMSDSTKSYYYERIKKAEKVYDLILENESKLNIQTKCDLDASGTLSKASLMDIKLDHFTVTKADPDARSSINDLVDELIESIFQKQYAVINEKAIESETNSERRGKITISCDIKNNKNEINVNNIKSKPNNQMAVKRKAKIIFQRLMSKEDEMKIDKSDATISTICSIL